MEALFRNFAVESPRLEVNHAGTIFFSCRAPRGGVYSLLVLRYPLMHALK